MKRCVTDNNLIYLRRIIMERLNKKISKAVDRPVKVLQFGEGNFLRAFVDYMFDVVNEKTDFNGGVVIVKPIEFGNLDRFHDQECQYTLQLRGIVDGEPKKETRIITTVTAELSLIGFSMVNIILLFSFSISVIFIVPTEYLIAFAVCSMGQTR